MDGREGGKMDAITHASAVIDAVTQPKARYQRQADDWYEIEDSVRLVGVVTPQETVAYYDIDYDEHRQPFPDLVYVTVTVKGTKLRFERDELTDEEVEFIEERLTEWMREAV